MTEPAAARNVTLRDIAQKLGVNHSTVSRALQNVPTISLARRKEIQDAAHQMGYRPNAIATILGHQRHAHQQRPISTEIAWINGWKEPKQLRQYLEFDLYWKGALSRAEQNGYRLEEFTCGKDVSPSRLEKILLARNIHGVLIPPHGGFSLPRGWDKIDWGKFSIIRFGYATETPRSHLVTSNQMACGQIAVENMHRLGYKRIGFVASPYRFRDFRAGFFTKEADFGVTPKASVFTVSSSEDHLPELPQFSAWLKKSRPDAILTDVSQTHQMLTKLGYRVPEDIGLGATSVLDGHANAGIDQHSEEIGKAAMETLISLLKHNEYGIPKVIREVLITGTWVDGSTLPPRAP